MKTAYIRIRVTPEEKEQIFSSAKKTKKSMSLYAREMLLNGKVVDYSELAKLTAEVNKIGTNINQAVRVMNTYFDYTDNDFNYIVSEFEKLKKLVLDEIQKNQ